MGTHGLIYIRTDANHKIASGHLMRCLSIASACKSLGMEVCFLVSEGKGCSLFRELSSSQDGFDLFPLKTALYDNLELELGEVSRLLYSQPQRPIFLLDSYYVTGPYLAAIKPLARVAYLDDLQLFDYPVDLLINYDVISQASLPSYKAAYQKAGRLLLGATYAPLRPQFQNNPISVRKQAANLLITTGGSDPCHFCLRFLHGIKENPSAWPFHSPKGLNIHMVIGKLNTDRDAIFEQAKTLPFLFLHENVSDIASLMKTCDLAVSAAGTTLYELCALGLPTVSFALADNQLTAAKAFHTAGAIPWAGDIRISPREVMNSLHAFITSMSCQDSYYTRKSAHDTMRKLVDGNGSLRIAEALRKLPVIPGCIQTAP